MIEPHNQFGQLEAQVEAELAGLAQHIDARVPEGLIERLGAQTRLAVHEAWLAEQPHPRPSPALLQRVGERIAAELSAAPAVAGPRRWWPPNSRTGGALAAAAMLLMCIGVIRTVGSGSGRGASVMPATEVHESVSVFVQAAETALTGDTFSAATISELDGIGRRISAWPESSQSQDDELDAVMQKLMEAFEQADQPTEGALG